MLLSRKWPRFWLRSSKGSDSQTVQGKSVQSKSRNATPSTGWQSMVLHCQKRIATQRNAPQAIVQQCQYCKALSRAAMYSRASSAVHGGVNYGSAEPAEHGSVAQ